jgi:hypothetical protein
MEGVRIILLTGMLTLAQSMIFMEYLSCQDTSMETTIIIELLTIMLLFSRIKASSMVLSVLARYFQEIPMYFVELGEGMWV